MQTVKPPRLQPGDSIGIVAPASPASDPGKIKQGAAYIEKMGYHAVIGTHAFDVDGYLAGTDADRAADLNAMFADPDIKAIFAVRGGYGTPRILDLIDYDAISKHPKIFVGYSDCTALQCALYGNAGLVSFSGPMVAVEMRGTMDPFTERNFWSLLTDGRSGQPLPAPEGERWDIVHGGTGEGILMGGNCTLLNSLLGTPYFPDPAGALLYIEEIDEKPYRIDRMFAQLRHAGIFQRVAGILLGSFDGCVPAASDGPSLTIDRIASDYFSALNVPVIRNLAYGHRPSKLTLPFGIRASIDTRRGRLVLDESAVE